MEQELMRITVAMPDDLLGHFDAIVKSMGNTSRSDCIRDAIRSYIRNYDWLCEVRGERIGLVIIIYESERKGLVDQLARISKEYFRQINSLVQVHLDKETIMELVIMQGDAMDIVGFAEKVMTRKGVTFLKLATIPPCDKI